MVTSTDAEEACKGVDIAVMVGGFPRKVRGFGVFWGGADGCCFSSCCTCF